MKKENDYSISWDVDIPVATDRHVLGDILKAIGSAFLLVAIILSVVLVRSRPRLEDFLNMFKVVGALAGIFLALAWIIALVVFGNKYHARFTVAQKGVSFETLDKRAKTAGRLATVVGAFSGKPGVAGSGLLAMSQQSMSIRWRGVFKAVFDDRRKTIVLRNTWRKILVIYCTKENYGQVAEFVKTQMESRKPSSFKSPLPAVALHSLLTIIASVPLFMLVEWPFNVNLFVPIFILSFALATILFVPLFGIIVIGGLVVFLGMVFVAPIWRYGFSLGDQEGVGLILVLAGISYLIWVSVQAMRFKVPSLLMADIEDMS